MEQNKICLPTTRKNRLRGTAALLLALLCLLPGCGKKGDDEATVELPTEYTFGEETITALSSEEEGVTFAQAKTVTYLYNGLSSSGTTVSSYTSQLVSDGFTVVDEELVKTDKPDFTTDEGSVRLAKDIIPEETEEDASDSKEEDEEPEDDSEESESDEASQDKTASKDDTESSDTASDDTDTSMVTLIVLDWSEGACSVTIDEQEGKITIPETPVSSTTHNISLTEAIDYLTRQSPAALGLSGDSMDEYHVYAQEGAVMVEDYVCLRLNVYSTNNAAGTNQFEGSFLLTSDGKHLFRTNALEGTVEEVDLS